MARVRRVASKVHEVEEQIVTALGYLTIARREDDPQFLRRAAGTLADALGALAGAIEVVFSDEIVAGVGGYTAKGHKLERRS